MRWFLFLIVTLSAPCLAQVSADEAQRRLAERAAARQASEPERLRSELAERDKTIEGLRRELQTLRDELSALREENKRLAAAMQQAQQPQARTPQASPPAAAAQRTPAADAGGKVIAKVGDLEVRLLDYGVGKVKVRNAIGGDVADSVDQLLWLKIAVTNRSAARKLNYTTWRGADFAIGRDYASASDAAGNVYKRINFGIAADLVDSVKSESIYPGKTIIDILVFEQPVPGTEAIKIELPGKNIGGDQAMSLDLPLSK